ncbi:methyl-accepting chemotaxis protein [Chitinibacter sp. ZOR0017]|uniref:methyl-accepting chemotaxis protein n=1 Tax=Chitinibacter sp. ZOR0017 TaxID=1339254 RepID=UPI000647D4C8|nr:methyl-accepting chemotaxis protein [Chitinibacter sp. ZOR0017]
MLMNLRVRTRLLVLSILALLGMALLSGLDLLHLRESMREERMMKVKSQVETAAGVIGHFRTLSQKGVLSAADAQKAAVEALRNVRFDKTDYFFIFDTNQVYRLMPTKPEFEGQNKSDLKDSNGKLILKEMTAAAQQGGGFVDYFFTKQGSNTPEPKISYAILIPEWNWVLGTGVYVDDIDKAFRNALLLGIAQLLGLAALVGFVALAIGKSIVRQLGCEPKDGMAIMQRVAEGDLRVDIQNAPTGSILATLGKMAHGLRAVMSQVRGDAEVLSRQATLIANSSREISIAAGRQADATTSMAAAMEELTVSINHISESSGITEQASRQATELAETGVGQVTSATSTMEHIAASVTQATGQIRQLDTKAREISGIAAVIKDIAGQTNLLALNAAIEAARAGEQGRGFAVVADEVRKLAERSASATVDIEHMLASIQGETVSVVDVMDAAIPQVERGVELARNVAHSLKHIHSGAEDTLAHLHEVASATKEQSMASNSIAARVEDISQMVEETSTSIHHAAENAAEVERIAGKLNELVGHFKV